MTEQIPPTPETPEVPQQVTVDIQQLAKMMAEESAKAAQDAIATIGLYKTRGEVVAKDADEHVQVRRESALNDDGSAGDPDPGFYPVPSPGTLPQVGDTVWCVGNNGGLVVLGKEADAAYKDLPAVLAKAMEALAQPPIGTITGWGGAADPADGKWLICDGRVLTTAAYPELSAVLGTSWNLGGEAAGQFRLPFMQGRAPVGASGAAAGLTDRARGVRFGAETHQLVSNEMPSHSHTVSETSTGSHAHGGSTGDASVGHTHGVVTGSYFNMSGNFGNGRRVMSPDDWDGNVSKTTGGVNTPGTSHDHSIDTSSNHSHDVSLSDTGGGGSHNNLPPSIAMHFIIRAKL